MEDLLEKGVQNMPAKLSALIYVLHVVGNYT